MNTTQWLINQGLTNRDTEDIGSLSSPRKRDPVATFCSSQWCHDGISRRGKLVATYVIDRCPFCDRGSHLMYESVDSDKAIKLQARVDKELDLKGLNAK